MNSFHVSYMLTLPGKYCNLQNMTGIVLAGGESRRMGVNKAQLRVDGIPLIERVVTILSGIFPRIIVVANAPLHLTLPGLTVVNDIFRGMGPLAGIHAGLLHSADEYNFVAACDMPYLDPALISHLLSLASGHEIVVPTTGGRPEPLHAVYARSLVPRIEALLAEDRRMIQGLYENARVRYVPENETDQIDPLRRSFLNLNTPDEYKEATCSDLECRNCS